MPSHEDSSSFGLFLCKLANGEMWAETCIIDEDDAVRVSSEAWDFLYAGRTADTSSALPSDRVAFPGYLIEWAAATIGYHQKDMRLVMDSMITIDPEVDLSCRVGISEISNHFEEHICFESDSTQFKTYIAKIEGRCVDR